MLPRNISQRERRRHKCPCPECGNLVYHCCFGFSNQSDAAGFLPVELVADARTPLRRPDPSRIDPAEYQRVVKAYETERQTVLCHSGPLVAALSESCRRLQSLYGNWHASPAVCRAAQTALSACGLVDRDPYEALAGAERALRISPTCPDAYALQARLGARTLEDALQLYERGAREFVRVLSPSGWQRCSSQYGCLVAMALPLGGAVRCMEGEISTLCRLRRGEEAHQKMESLLLLTPPISEAPEAPVWAMAPEVVFRARGPAACLAWLSETMCDEVLEAPGAGVWWIATYALAWVAVHKAEGFKWSSLSLHTVESALEDEGPVGEEGDEQGDGEDWDCAEARRMARSFTPAPRSPAAKLRSGMALGACCVWMPHLVDMLVGDMPLPTGPQAHSALWPGNVSTQVAYARYCGDMWADTPGVLEFVRRYRNTYEVMGILHDARSGFKTNMADFRRYMAPPPPAGRAAAAATPAASAAAAATSPCPIFPDAIAHEGLGEWHGLVDLAVLFTEHLSGMRDPTMNAQDLEILQALLAAGCPLDPAGARPLPRSIRYFSALVIASYRGYGPEAVRALVRAGADPVMPDHSCQVAIVSAAGQGMWRELQAMLKAKRRLGYVPLPPAAARAIVDATIGALSHAHPAPPPTNVFELALLAAATSPCLPCVAGASPLANCCPRCDSDQAGRHTSGHGPWCSFDKVVEVLVAYGMTRVDGAVRSWLDAEACRAPASERGVRRAILGRLDALMREAQGSQDGKGAEGQTTEALAQGAEGGVQQPGDATGKEARGRGREAGKQQQEGGQQGPGHAVATSAAAAAAAAAGGTSGGIAPFDPRKMFNQDRQQPTTKPAPSVPAPGAAAAARAAAPPFDPRLAFKQAAPAKQQQQQRAKPSQPQAQQQQEKPGGREGAPAHGARAGDPQGSLGGGQRAGLAAGAAGAAAAPGVTPEAHQDKSHCWCCAKAKDRAAGVRLQKCSVCFTARYCSAECQHAHWQQHKTACKLLTEAAAAAAAVPEAAGVAAGTAAPAGRRKGANK